MNNFQCNYVELLNTYLANIFVLNNKLYNLHWNVVGSLFFTWHEKLQEYYEFTTEAIDEVAETIKMKEGFPITTLKEYTDKSTIKSIESRNYTEGEILTILVNDFNFMKLLTQQVADYATEINDLSVIDLMTGYMKFFDKQLWMIKASAM